MATRMDPADLAYDMIVPCCGRDWYVPRTNALAKRVEQHFGAIYPLSLVLRSTALKAADLARLIRVLIEDKDGAPDLPAIEAWVFARGASKLEPALAAEVLTLIAGNDAVAELQARRAAQAGEGDPGPFAPTAA